MSYHAGDLSTLPSNASPGLVFMADAFKVIDSESTDPDLTIHFSPDARFHFGRCGDWDINEYKKSFAIRQKDCLYCSRTTIASVDVDLGNGKRKVYVESSSKVRFREDPGTDEEANISMIDCSTYLLEKDDKYKLGWKCVEVQDYSDPEPCFQRFGVIMKTKGIGGNCAEGK